MADDEVVSAGAIVDADLLDRTEHAPQHAAVGCVARKRILSRTPLNSERVLRKTRFGLRLRRRPR